VSDDPAARILVVDDNAWNRDLIARRLSQRGYAVEEAAGGLEAIRKVKEGRFDLVLLDVMMPEVSGLDVLRAIREKWTLAELPVVMATAREGSEAVVEAFALGANDYVTKPLDFPVVLARIRTQLALKLAQERLREDSGMASALMATCPSCALCHDQAIERCPADGAALTGHGNVPLRIGERYRLARVLGEGGMATVFEAQDERLPRTVAVKILRPEFFGEGVIQKRFEQEAEALGRISHPGVVTLFDFGGLPGGALYLVMELLRGQDLDAILKAHGPGTPRQVAALLRQAGSALGAAHRAGVLHRDIKPGNFFFVPEDGTTRVKLLDFGLAKPLRVAHPLTLAGLIVGTPAYMSPEQIQERPVDERSDLYSLATVAWEAMTGLRMIRSRDLYEVLNDIVDGTRSRLSDHLPGISRAADTAFSMAIEHDPVRRPGSVEGWVDSFAAALDACPSTAAGWPALFPASPRPVRGDPWTETLPGIQR
jgi:CheY-like chemotaxis protein/tRNA A-37 threonylcarbamoyl transferase component Bud32